MLCSSDAEQEVRVFLHCSIFSHKGRCRCDAFREAVGFIAYDMLKQCEPHGSVRLARRCGVVELPRERLVSTFRAVCTVLLFASAREACGKDMTIRRIVVVM